MASSPDRPEGEREDATLHRRITVLLVCLILGAGSPAAARTVLPLAGGPAVPVIVVLDGSPSDGAGGRLRPAAATAARSSVRSEARRLGAAAERTFGVVTRAFTTTVTARQRAELALRPGVAAIIDDTEVSYADQLTLTEGVSGRPAPRRLRHQVRSIVATRIGVRERAPTVGSGRRATPIDADVAIVDTGISRHPDLRIAGGKDCTRSGTWSDGYGHGTAVAGILGARDDRRGIVGLAPGVRLWSVRVFDGRGRSRLSNHLCALDWIAGKRDRRHPGRPFFEAVNMSFTFRPSAGTPRRTTDGTCARLARDPFHEGICRIVRQGTVVVGAAGNQGQAVGRREPASLPEAIGVSAMADFDGRPGGKGHVRSRCGIAAQRERDDRFSRFSNFGGQVDLIAPGTCVWATYLRGSYALVTGTSFATPVVVAAALWYLHDYPDASPAQVRQALVHAGRRDWRRGSDRDHAREPRVDVRAFAPPPTFEYADVDPVSLRRGQGAVTIALSRRRQFGHTAPITQKVVETPRGVRATLDGTRVRLQADGSAERGEAVVVVRATDGDTTRRIRIPLLVMDAGGPTPTPEPTADPNPTPEPTPTPTPEPTAHPTPTPTDDPTPEPPPSPTP